MDLVSVRQKQKTVAKPRDGQVGFEGLLLVLSVESENWNWSMESRGEFSPVLNYERRGEQNLLALNLLI